MRKIKKPFFPRGRNILGYIKKPFSPRGETEYFGLYQKTVSPGESDFD
jgi:hypothetical protein